jgi:uncharacterized Zn finger protein
MNGKILSFAKPIFISCPNCGFRIQVPMLIKGEKEPLEITCMCGHCFEIVVKVE